MSEDELIELMRTEFDAEEYVPEPDAGEAEAKGDVEMTRLPQGAGGFDINALMKQAQQMQAEMAEAQEKLKDEVVDASAGGGMVKVKMSGDLRLLEIAIDPEAIDPEDAELLQDMVLASVNEAIRAAQELAASKMGGVAGLGGGGGAGGGLGACCPACSSRLHPPPIDADRRARQAAGHRPADRAAARLPHPALRATRTPSRSPPRSARSRSRIGLCETCFNLAEGPHCAICADPRRGRELICVVEEPQDVIPIERTGEYRGLYHVLGGALSPIDGIDPEDLKIAELVDAGRRRARSRRS